MTRWARPERELGGHLVRLRLPSRDDPRALFEYASAPDGLQGTWVPLPPAATLAECTALVADWLAGWRGERSVQGAAFVVCATDGAAMIGQIGLRDRGGGVELSYGVAPHRRGQGVATEAARLAAEWLLTTHQATEVELRIGKSHVESRRVAARAGFRPAGTIDSRSAGGGDTYEDVRYVFDGVAGAARRALRSVAVRTIPASTPPATSAIAAVQAGDLESLGRLLEDEPDLATARIARRGGQTLTLLHVAADWPGHVPNAAKSIAALVDAGADVNARTDGTHTQTPLHWAASSDDVDVLDALLDAGADIEAPGAFNGVGSPLDNAVGFGQWKAARRLVERGAETNLWHAAALGLTDRIEELFAAEPSPSPSAVTEAFWQACHGNQQGAAELLAERGADLNWIGYDDLTPLDNARRSGADDLAEWVLARGGRSAKDVSPPRPER